MSFTFDPYKHSATDVSKGDDVILTNPTALKELENYWASLPRSRGIPKRSDVNPMNMGTLLEDSFILERVAPTVARVRVAGRNIGKLIGIEPRGLPLTTFMEPQARRDIESLLEQAFIGSCIVEIPLIAVRADRQPKLQGKMLLLPLQDDYGRVSRLLGILVMSGRRGIGGRRFVLADDADVRIEKVVGLRLVDDTVPSLDAAMTPAFGPKGVVAAQRKLRSNTGQNMAPTTSFNSESVTSPNS